MYSFFISAELFSVESGLSKGSFNLYLNLSISLIAIYEEAFYFSVLWFLYSFRMEIKKFFRHNELICQLF